MACKFLGAIHATRTHKGQIEPHVVVRHCTHTEIEVPFCVETQSEKDAAPGSNYSVCQTCPLYDGPYGNCTWKSTDGIVWDSVPITPCLHGTCNEPAFDPDEPGQEAIVSCAPMEQP